MTDYALLINFKYCTGCHVCEVSCRNAHNYSLEDWGIKVTELGPIQMVDMDNKWLFDYVPVPSDLCDLCEERRAEGKDAACVHHCLAKCMEVVPVEEISEAMARNGEKTAVFIP